MDLADVARQPLSELGMRPLGVAGFTNRLAVFLVSRLPSRERASRIMTGATYATRGRA